MSGCPPAGLAFCLLAVSASFAAKEASLSFRTSSLTVNRATLALFVTAKASARMRSGATRSGSLQADLLLRRSPRTLRRSEATQACGRREKHASGALSDVRHRRGESDFRLLAEEDPSVIVAAVVALGCQGEGMEASPALLALSDTAVEEERKTSPTL